MNLEEDPLFVEEQEETEGKDQRGDKEEEDGLSIV